MIVSTHELNATVKQFEGKFAILETTDGQTVRWLIKNLPEDIEEGKGVRLVLSTEQSEAVARERLAQTVLNQILQT